MKNACEILPGCRVLIVEDEMLVAMELESLLREQGCEVLGPVPTIDRALTLIEREHPDAAVLDVNLNGTTAAPVAAVLRELDVPFVLATGYRSKQALQPELRGAPRLDKPVDHDSLVCALARILEPRGAT